MRHLAAAILLALGGKTVGKNIPFNILDEASVKAVLTAGGVKVDDAKVKKVVEQVSGKDVLKLAKEGLSKVGSVSSAPAKEEKKEEKKDDKKGKEAAKPKVEEPEEEGAGFGDLFG